jgi:butyryl-CoA dehydrogenase
VLVEELGAATTRGRASGLDATQCEQLRAAGERLAQTTLALGQRGLGGDVPAMLLHASDFLELASIVVIAWQHLVMATAARLSLTHGGAQSPAFYEGKLRAAQYWYATELPRVAALAELCERGDRSFRDVPADGW